MNCPNCSRTAYLQLSWTESQLSDQRAPSTVCKFGQVEEERDNIAEEFLGNAPNGIVIPIGK